MYNKIFTKTKVQTNQIRIFARGWQTSTLLHPIDKNGLTSSKLWVENPKTSVHSWHTPHPNHKARVKCTFEWIPFFWMAKLKHSDGLHSPLPAGLLAQACSSLRNQSHSLLQQAPPIYTSMTCKRVLKIYLYAKQASSISVNNLWFLRWHRVLILIISIYTKTSLGNL